MPKMKTLTLRGITFEVADEQARNDIETLSNTVDAIPTPIQADLSQNDSTAADYVKNRTHYVEEGIKLQWDGSTEGREVGTWRYDNTSQYTLCKVSDKVYTADDFVPRDDYGLKLTVIGSEMDTAINEMYLYLNDITEDAGLPLLLVCVSGINTSRHPCLISVGAPVDFDQATAGFDLHLPSAGTYLADMSNAAFWDDDAGVDIPIGYIASVTSEGTVHKLDKKYLPDDIGGGVFKVNVSYDATNSVWVCDKTYAEIKAAEEAKTPIVGTFTNKYEQVYTLIGCDSMEVCCRLVAFDVLSMPTIYRITVYDGGDVDADALTLTATSTALT